MSNLELHQIVASCVWAFHHGADRLELLQLRAARGDAGHTSLSEREKMLAEMLQQELKNAGDAVKTHFEQAQLPLGQYGILLRQGDLTAKDQLQLITHQMQEEITQRLGADQTNIGADTASNGLMALMRAAMAKQTAATQSISQLQERISQRISSGARTNVLPTRRDSARSATDAAITRGSSQRVAQGSSSNQRRTLTAVDEQRQLIPEIRADDEQSLAPTDFDQDDRFTMAQENPYYEQGAPQRHMQRTDFSSAASFRAALAPEPIEKQIKPEIPMESAGPFFPPPGARRSHEDREIPTLAQNRRDRPSLPESQRGPRDVGLRRMLSPSSIGSGGSSPRVSEPDSAISLRMINSKPYCTGAWNAQEKLIDGFARDFLPTLPGANKRELCWKCKECDFNFCDPEGQLLEGIYFEEGVRFRFTFLARSHVLYEHPENAFKPSYQYGCLFCTAEGRRTSTYSSTEKLMAHIRAKHRTNLTPEVRERVRCIVGRSAGREEEWDCNLADIGSQGGILKKFMIRSVTGMRT